VTVSKRSVSSSSTTSAFANFRFCNAILAHPKKEKLHGLRPGE
jgi:hypothetical protein